MATDAFAAEPAGPSQHVHPHLTEERIALAQSTALHPTHRDTAGNPAVMSFDPVLGCCGLSVSELAPGTAYPNELV